VQVRGELSAELHLFGPLKPDFAASMKESLAAPDLHWHGAVSQATLAEEMRKADVLVLPSLEEAFGLVVPQALSCGIPCVVADTVGAKDLIQEGRNGSVVPARDAEALAGALRWWAAHPEAFDYEPLSWKDAAEKLLALQASLVYAADRP
jgi:alpha-maltose-1-phosphate synthase